MSRQPEQDTLDESLLPVYSGSSGTCTPTTFPFVCWDYAPTWFEVKNDVIKHRVSDLHVLGDALDGHGERMTECLCPATPSEATGVGKVYHNVEALEYSIEQETGVCVECMGRLGRHLLMTYRHHRELWGKEHEKWAQLSKADNMGVRRVGRPFKEHDNE